ncbi:hypothetical protein BOX15_Mlig011050g1 [Macrostomum lignano]|uniref:TLC domain-containing protein n=1 Tax=Macrostomum lignano TaxID=282301 RepID=A0A267EXW1_9PLAT|nr:hypothetical protein BOX15_Mlig011050g1 [Macrostomum lignano]
MDWLVREVSVSFTGNRYPVHIGWLIVQVLCASLFWLFMYAALCLSMPRFRCEWHCRIVTAVHALIVSALAFLDVFIIGRIPFYHKNQVLPYTELERLIFTASLGYFIFDISWCLYYQTEGPFMLFHHAMSILGLAGTLLMGKCGAEMAATVGGTEVTNPVLQLRWFLREQGFTGTRLMMGVEVLFMVSFGVMRLLLGGALIISYFTNPHTELLGRLAAVVIYGIGVIFYAQLCSYCMHRFRRRAPIVVASNGTAHHHLAQSVSDSSLVAASPAGGAGDSPIVSPAGVATVLSFSASSGDLNRALDTAGSSRKQH